ncbi:MAG TPA: glycosyltransferase family 4 protein [Thermoanaerobaculia bacterium]|nr:glycosyltransferase family 4 protein [Thermoanaerobaculia bacterium]
MGKRGLRVWVISELYYPELTSTGYFLTHIAEELARRYDVGVLAAQPTYSARGVRAPTRERIRGVAVVRCRSTRFHKDKLLGRIANAVTLTASLFVHALFRFRRGDVALFVTNPPTVPFAMFAACRMRGVTPLLLIHDVYPQAFVATGLVRRGSFAERAMLRLNRALYSAVERVITIGRDMSRLVDAVAGGRATVAMIPNWGDIEAIRPMPRLSNPILASLGILHKFVVQYVGNMGRTHGLEVLIEAASALRDRTDIHFLFSGSGAKRLYIENAAAGCPNITVLAAYRPRESLDEILNACDLSMISFNPGMSGVSVPSRMYDVLASGHPLLALTDSDSELAMLIAEERVGWSVAPNDREAFIGRLLYAVEHRDEIEEAGRRARAVAERKYSLSQIGEQYRDLIASVLAERDV